MPANATQSDAEIGEWVYGGPVCIVGGAVTCSEIYICESGEPEIRWNYFVDGELLQSITRCPGDPPQGAPPPQVTPADAQRAFRTVNIATSSMQIFPVGGTTMVNVPTVFTTTAEPFDATVTLLGQQVTFHARPVSFSWNPGDGSAPITTTDPGAAYTSGSDPSQLINHRYQQTARSVTVSVTVTWDADWDLNGVPQGDVPGEVSVTGPGAGLTVKQAQPVLTAP